MPERGNISFFEDKLKQRQEKAQQTKNARDIAHRVIGNKYGHDIRVAVSVHEDGTTILDYQPSDGEKYDRMMQRIEPGLRSVDGYPYEVTILDAQVMLAEENGIGNETFIGEAYLLGDHYKYGVGTRVPREEAWNGEQDETRVIFSVSNSMYTPDKFYARIFPVDYTEYHIAERSVAEVRQRGEKPREVLVVERAVHEYRNPPLEEMRTDMAAD